MANQLNDKDYKDEVNYFKEISHSSNIHLSANNREEMNSYKNAICSDIIIGMDSTLMIEMLGCQKKVIWGSTCDNQFLRKRAGLAYKEKMPKEIVLDHLNKKSFNKKVMHLFDIDKEEYLKLITDAIFYFMNININKNTLYPHEVIRNNIDKYLSKNA